MSEEKLGIVSTPKSERMLELIKGNSSITTKELAKQIGITARTITTKELAKQIGITARTIVRDKQALQNANKLERVGSTKSGHWKIILIN